MAIYVEILIRAPMEALWRHTQEPELHERWDLRFTQIQYLPKDSPADAQRFLYTTQMGLGMKVSGEGESLAQRDLAHGSRISSLRFGSSDPRSIILEGSGYWKYAPTQDGVRFLTSYDYKTRFGVLGEIFDRLAFRPLMGWATAWSFDRLRLWLEEGLAPDQSLRNAVVHLLARGGMAFIFVYHGLVPKLLFPDPTEMALLQAAGAEAHDITWLLPAIGVGEVAFGLGMLLFWQYRGPAVLCLGLMALSTVGIALTSPRILMAAFNPVSLNLAVACLAAADLLVLGRVPSAGRCRRRPTDSKP